MYAKIKKLLLDILFPSVCLICGDDLSENLDNETLCKKCAGAIPINTSLYCPVCDARRPEFDPCHPSSKFLLGAAASYDCEPIKTLIWKLKFRGQKIASRALAQALFIYLDKIGIAPFLNQKNFAGIIAVPLHEKRMRKRGYNQTELIARKLVEKLNSSGKFGTRVELKDKILVRTKNTEPQKEKKREARLENLRNAFAVANKDEVAGKNFIVLDDVFTSGATMSAAVSALKESGAKKILGLVVAKV